MVKYSFDCHRGVQATELHRHALGYVLRGKLRVYRGDSRQEFSGGTAYYLRAGTHYLEYVPEGDKPFEQILFFYDIPQLNHILSHLNNEYGVEVVNTHSCEQCTGNEAVFIPAWAELRHFFKAVDQHLSTQFLGSDRTADTLRMTELVYHLLCRPECCFKRCLLDNADLSMAEFEQLVNEHVFSDESLASLAARCGRSMTPFKNDFKRHFGEAPHQYIVRQRLLHARLQLVSTNRSVADIGRRAKYQNPSHFIKSFKKQFGETPAVYRRLHEKAAAE